jgi:hypothetical protein
VENVLVHILGYCDLMQENLQVIGYEPY